MIWALGSLNQTNTDTYHTLQFHNPVGILSFTCKKNSYELMMLLWSSLALLYTYHLNSCRAMQSCYKHSFSLNYFTICPCSYSFFSDIPALPQPPSARVSPPGRAWVFYICHIHMHLVQNKSLPLLCEIQLLSSKADCAGDLVRLPRTRLKFLTENVASHPQLTNFSVSLTEKWDLSMQRGQQEHGLYLTYLRWCLLSWGEALLKFLCDRQAHN